MAADPVKKEEVLDEIFANSFNQLLTVLLSQNFSRTKRLATLMGTQSRPCVSDDVITLRNYLRHFIEEFEKQPISKDENISHRLALLKQILIILAQPQDYCIGHGTSTDSKYIVANYCHLFLIRELTYLELLLFHRLVPMQLPVLDTPEIHNDVVALLKNLHF